MKTLQMMTLSLLVAAVAAMGCQVDDATVSPTLEQEPTEAAQPVNEKPVTQAPRAEEPATDPVAEPAREPEESEPEWALPAPAVDPVGVDLVDGLDEAPTDTPAGGTLGEGVDVNIAPTPPVVEPAARQRRRMNIDQLEKSILQVTGGIGWTASNGTSNFQALSRTLGKPDYIDLTSEDLEPSALFQKFLDDAARQTCFKLAAKEQKITLDPKVLMVEAGPKDSWAKKPGKILNNLQQLLLRFHGDDVAIDDPQMEQWAWLYESAEFISKDPVVAWRTVCVGLMLHPGFYTY